MVSYGDVRNWQAEPLQPIGSGQLNTLCTTLVGFSDEVGDAGKTSRWHGDAATGATNASARDPHRHGGPDQRGRGHAHRDGRGCRHGQWAHARRDRGPKPLRTGTTCASRTTATCTTLAGFSFPSDQERAVWEGERNRIKAELADRVKEIIRRADDLDNDLKTAASRCLERGGVGNLGYDGLTEAALAGGDALHLSLLGTTPRRHGCGQRRMVGHPRRGRKAVDPEQPP
jgi:hypothetical protein